MVKTCQNQWYPDVHTKTTNISKPSDKDSSKILAEFILIHQIEIRIRMNKVINWGVLPLKCTYIFKRPLTSPRSLISQSHRESTLGPLNKLGDCAHHSILKQPFPGIYREKHLMNRDVFENAESKTIFTISINFHATALKPAKSGPPMSPNWITNLGQR